MFLPYKDYNPENCNMHGFRYSMSNCVFESAFEAVLKNCKCFPIFHQEEYQSKNYQTAKIKYDLNFFCLEIFILNQTRLFEMPFLSDIDYTPMEGPPGGPPSGEGGGPPSGGGGQSSGGPPNSGGGQSSGGAPSGGGNGGPPSGGGGPPSGGGGPPSGGSGSQTSGGPPSGGGPSGGGGPPEAPISTCRGTGLQCAYDIFNTMSRDDYKQVSITNKIKFMLIK